MEYLECFSFLQYTKIEEEDSLTFDQFVSQIGGQFGLFLGASIVSVVQVCHGLLEFF